MTIKSNISKRQREIIRELTEDESIIICPADKGKAVVVEDREVYLLKTQDQISDCLLYTSDAADDREV